MSRRRRGRLRGQVIRGVCRLCGVDGPLSFEHVPPQKAFNDRPARVLRGDAVVNVDPDDLRGRIEQGGAGEFTLCGPCNNDTGHRYAPAFIGWAYQAMWILRATRGLASLNYVYHIFPLRVLKQVACMFFSVNGPDFHKAHPKLQKFVLDPSASGLVPALRIYAFLNGSERTRQTGVAVRGRFDTGRIEIISEIASSPIGFVMAFGDSPAPDGRLIDITFMAKCHYNDWKHVALALPVLSVYTGVPVDYRDRDTARRQAGLADQ